MWSRSRPGPIWSWAIWECPDWRPSGPVFLGKSQTWTGTMGFGQVQTRSQSVLDWTSPILGWMCNWHMTSQVPTTRACRPIHAMGPDPLKIGEISMSKHIIFYVNFFITITWSEPHYLVFPAVAAWQCQNCCLRLTTPHATFHLCNLVHTHPHNMPSGLHQQRVIMCTMTDVASQWPPAYCPPAHTLRLHDTHAMAAWPHETHTTHIGHDTSPGTNR